MGDIRPLILLEDRIIIVASFLQIRTTLIPFLVSLLAHFSIQFLLQVNLFIIQVVRSIRLEWTFILTHLTWPGEPITLQFLVACPYSFRRKEV